MKRIAITADINLQETSFINQKFSYFVPRKVVSAIVHAGAMPVVLPILPADMVNDTLLDSFDGLLIPGGPDVSPSCFGAEPSPKIGKTYLPRDQFEMALVKKAVALHKPIMGICRGIQLINIALGGTVYQDLASEYDQLKIQHAQAAPGFLPVHHVSVTPGSHLAARVGEKAYVNSRHHQAVKDLGKGLKVVARASDGVIEGIENADGSIVAVQWHPEDLFRHQPEQFQLFKKFVERV